MSGKKPEKKKKKNPFAEVEEELEKYSEGLEPESSRYSFEG